MYIIYYIAVNGGYDSFNLYSPTQLVNKLSQTELYNLPPMLMLHGSSDTTVPPSSSQRFAAALVKAGIHNDRCKVLVLKQPTNHVTSILDLMLKQNTYKTQIQLIHDFVTQFSSDNTNQYDIVHKYDNKSIKHETIEQINLPSHL